MNTFESLQLEGFEHKDPTNVGTYLVACDEGDYEPELMYVVMHMGELSVRDPYIGYYPVNQYDLLNVLWKKVDN